VEQGRGKIIWLNKAEAVGKNCRALLQARTILGIEIWGRNCSIRDCAARHVDIPNRREIRFIFRRSSSFFLPSVMS
jgi:hypothetical protein